MSHFTLEIDELKQNDKLSLEIISNNLENRFKELKVNYEIGHLEVIQFNKN